MSDAETLFAVLRQSADPAAPGAVEELVRDAPDPALSRVNALAFAAAHGLDAERVIATFLHATRLGLFQMSWNVLCPGCGGVLGAYASLKTVQNDQYHCRLCAAGYEPTLDEMVKSSSPSIRASAGFPRMRRTSFPSSTITGRSSAVPVSMFPTTWSATWSRSCST